MAKILAVDDSASMRQIVSFTLKGAGHDVIEASDGVEALKIAQGQGVDLVLSDVNMPNMNGLELCANLRKLATYKFTPILMLTTESAGDKKMEGNRQVLLVGSLNRLTQISFYLPLNVYWIKHYEY